MLGAIIGDVVGSIYERRPIKTKEFSLFSDHCYFTDDTVLTAAVAQALLGDRNFAKALERFYYHYPNVPYGGRFYDWGSES